MNHIDLRKASDAAIRQWRENEKKALRLIKIVGDLRFDRSIELILFRRSIYDARPSEVIQDHQLGRNYLDDAISLDTTLSIATEIAALESLAPSKIDIGTLAREWATEKPNYSNLTEFLHYKLRAFVGADKLRVVPVDVVLYGFGRIGRLLARRIIEQTGRGEQLRLKAIVLRPKLADLRLEIEKRVGLLQQDSVHGEFHGTVDIADDNRSLIINGNRVAIIFAKTPEEVDYTEHGIENALLIDNTGVWRDKAGLSQHLRPGISRVILTAPGKDVPNIVHGVNQDTFEDEQVLSAASCTTNAITPIIRVLDEQFGITHGHIETIHAYTSDQNLLDNFHKKPRRGRAAAINMVLTTTGAASAVSKVLPHLKGKLTGNAVRVPTPDVSLAIISLGIEKPSSVEEVNGVLREASLHGNMIEQIHYSHSSEYVSSHAVGMTSTSVLDAPSTIVSPDGKNIIVYAWYDNEYGYACQVVRLAKHVAKVRRYAYY